MQIHVLIPVPPPSFTGPDPPVVFHYTTGNKLRSIINSGAIKPSTAHVPASEKPVAWFSTSHEWEPTATKSPVTGKPGQLITAKAQNGLVRISVPGACAPYGIQQLPKIAGTSLQTYTGLLLAGLELGADPGVWRFTPNPVPTALFREVEFYDFANDKWLEAVSKLAKGDYQAGDLQEGQEHLGLALVSDDQPAEVSEPRHGPFDGPAAAVAA